MKLARSTYCYRARRATAEKAAIHTRIAALCAEFPRYGYRRITHQLRAEGLVVNHKAVGRWMRLQGLQVRPLRKFVRPRIMLTTARSFPVWLGDFGLPDPINCGWAI